MGGGGGGVRGAGGVVSAFTLRLHLGGRNDVGKFLRSVSDYC